MLNMLQPVQKREAGITANVLLSLIDRMKNEAPLQMRYLYFKALAYHVHGNIALDEGTEESARRAVVHFENQLRVNEANANYEGIATAKGNIAYAKSMYEGGNNNEEVLKSTHDVYKLRAAEYGEGSKVAIDAGKVYAMKLQDAHRGGEATELLTKLLATSMRVLGPNHSTTKQVESVFKRTNINNSIHNDAYHE
jgi:hypothetical protein